MGKTRLIAETGAGQHAGNCYSSSADGNGMRSLYGRGRYQAPGIKRIQDEIVRATVIPVTTGTGTLKDACSACF